MSKVVTSITLDPAVKEDSQILANLEGFSLSAYINELLEQAVKTERYRVDEARRLKRNLIYGGYSAKET